MAGCHRLIGLPQHPADPANRKSLGNPRDFHAWTDDDVSTGETALSVCYMTRHPYLLKRAAALCAVFSLLPALPVNAQETQTSCAPKTPPQISSKVDGRHVILSARNGSKSTRPVRYKISWTAGSRSETTHVGVSNSGDALDTTAAWVAMAGSQAGYGVSMTYTAQAEYRCSGGKSAVAPVAQGSRMIEPIAAPVITSVSQSHTGEVVLRLRNMQSSGFIHVASGCCVVAVVPVSDTVVLAKPKSRVRLTFEVFSSTASGASLNSNSVSIVTR